MVMILNFIGKGMRSKKLQELEHKIATNIMKTPTKIRQELRSILAEFLMVRVKKVYKEFDYKPQRLVRSQSCPNISVQNSAGYFSMDRKRAFSECQDNFILQRIQSDTDLERIDKELTFQGADQQADLIIKVVDALSMHEYVDSEPGCYEGFSEKEILASEQYASEWSLASQRMPPPPFRHRAASDVRYPSIPKLQTENEHTWYGQTHLAKYAKLIKDEKSSSEPNNDVTKEGPGFFKRIRNTLLSKDRNGDVEKGVDQSRPNQDERTTLGTNEHNQILENTSVADLIRALTALSDQTPGPSQENPKRTRRMPIKSNFQNRRSSLMPVLPSTTTSYKPNRRSSLMPTSDLSRFSTSALPYSGPRRSSLAPVSELPPPYHQVTQQSFPMSPSKIRRFSVRPVSNVNTSIPRFSKKDGEDAS